MSGVITKKVYEIHYYESHYNGEATITNIMDFFTDVATYQSEKLGLGIDFMSHHKIAWMLYKWDIDVTRYPKYMEKVTVVTEPYAIKKFYAYRKFFILDENEKVIVSAKSLWLLVDTERRKPIKIYPEMAKSYNLTESKQIEKLHKICELPEQYSSLEFRVRYSDIDTNGHVNNEKYAAWMIETVPRNIILNYALKNIKITYKKETVYGENVKIQTGLKEENNEVLFIHRILSDDGQILTEGETIWCKNK